MVPEIEDDTPTRGRRMESDFVRGDTVAASKYANVAASDPQQMPHSSSMRILNLHTGHSVKKAVQRARSAIPGLRKRRSSSTHTNGTVTEGFENDAEHIRSSSKTSGSRISRALGIMGRTPAFQYGVM